MKPIALITGATSGIGWATAQALADDFALIVCGRRADRLASLAETLSQQTEVTTLCFDVRDKAAVSAAFASLPANWRDIAVLINNAGNAHGLSPIHEGNLDDWDAMLDINVKGLLYATHALLPDMVAKRAGTIVNISSMAGLEVYPNGNVYCASKFAVTALSQAMKIDLNDYGIRVCAINPGLVETEFSQVRFKGDEAKAKSVYQNMTPLHAADVADAIAFVVTRPKHITIRDLTILPTDQANSTVVKRHAN